ncbi:MAG: putative baseplate assembly protein [Xanthomonadales bacterium]|nr:putative baseplate assembly protein [Xanthomonadales bacterium]
MTISCCNDPRRDVVRRFHGRTGLDFVEVSADQRTLFVYFLGKLPPEFAEDGPELVRHLCIEGGSRVTGIRILDVDPHISVDPEVDDWLALRLDRAGDFSRYTLQLRDIDGLDPMYASVAFSFKVGCPSDLDCAPMDACVETPPPEPAINYLAKDYASFRRLIEDRLALIAPRWNEHHVPDLGVALTELLAYTGDYLSYYQDAVASEAYLDTARQRISVRRHARLVDYRLHEGCNARAWVVVETSEDIELPAASVAFLGGIDPAAPLPTVLGPSAMADLGALRFEQFEALLDDARVGESDATLNWRVAHNRIRFHDWGRDDCCLSRGTTSATLIDSWHGDGRALALRPGDVLILKEVRGARSGLEGDADPTRCCAVRLTRVTPIEDPLLLVDAGENAPPRPTPLLRVEWGVADALPFALCLSALGPAPECARMRDLSLAWANVVLVDHGHRRDPQPLGTVPAGLGEVECRCEGQASEFEILPGKFRWSLADAPLTHRTPAPSLCAASRSLAQDPRAALPQLVLNDSSGQHWTPAFDLLTSGPDDRHVVAEIDNVGIAHLRFGDGELGLRPPAGLVFDAQYRVGNGLAGNLGRGAINRLRLLDRELSVLGLRIDNPMPAVGGLEPELLAEARMVAPSAFRKTLLRAITADDYARIAENDPRVQRAACELVWTGSWYEADVALDPLGKVPADEPLLGQTETRLHAYRRMGHDLHIEPASYVSIDLALEVCALPGYERGAVKAALLERFSAGRMRDGRLAWFHPDRLSFGQSLRMSELIAEAMSVAGVECVRVRRMQRLFLPANHEIENGLLPLSAHEIARVDGDPNHPEHGQLAIDVRGGR